MIAQTLLRQACLALFLCAGAVAATGAQPSRQYVPEPGEDGKDVMWLPSADTMVRRMLDLGRVTKKDFLIDLGSGDGRTVIAAAKRGARALGVEFNPDLVEFAKRQAAGAGVADRARFVRGDLFEADLSKADVITLFLLDEINLMLRPKLLRLRPGTRIVSNTFDMGEWKPDTTVSVNAGRDCAAYCTALLWIVPARVEGVWKLPNGELRLRQSFQMLSGTLQANGREYPVNGRLNGDRIQFVAGEEYFGRVEGDSLRGTVATPGAARPWRAMRVAAN